MNKIFIKITALALCIVMAASQFVACNNDPGTDTDSSVDTTTAPDDTVETTIPGVAYNSADYKIIRPEKTDDTVIDAASDLYAGLKELTKNAPQLKTDWVKSESEISSEAKEILIGNTNRPESAEALKRLSGSQWGIFSIGNKIVIVGTNDILTAAAVAFFISNYIQPYATENTFYLPELLEEVSGQYAPVSLVEDGKVKYKVIFSGNLDVTAKPNTNDRYDYPVLKAHELIDAIGNITGNSPAFGGDYIAGLTNPALAYEILVGKTSRSETAEFLAGIKADQYGWGVIGNKIVVTGWSDTTTGLAVDMFIKELQSSKGSADGKTTVDIIYDKPVLASFKGAVAIPEYTAAKLYWCSELTDNGWEYYYENTNETAYTAYLSKLAKSGYTEYSTNRIGDNLYATYTNANTFIYAYYTAYSKSVRIIAAPMKNTKLAPLTDTDYTKVTESKFTQMTFAYPGNSGNCYIVTLEDGSFIVYDGGAADAVDTKRLYDTLSSLNMRPDKKIVIAAWILTHEHADHFNNFLEFAKTYGKKVTVEKFICNTPTDVFAYNGRDISSKTYLNSYPGVAYDLGSPEVIKAHTGQRIAIRNCIVEVLFTIEDIFPQYLHVFNDASVVTRLHIGGQTIMMLGDAEAQPGQILNKSFENYMKSDIVQISHHGYGMCPLSVYNYIKAPVAFWPSDRATIEKLSSPTGTGYYGFGYALQHNQGFVDIFVAGDGTRTITLPYTAGSGSSVLG